MGFRLKPDVTDTIRIWRKEKHFRDIVYTIDSMGMRVNPIMNDSSEVLKRKYALFLGCSITFGMYEDDRGTLPYYFSMLDTNYLGYNFGCSGYGTSQLWLQLKSGELKSKMKGNKKTVSHFTPT